MAGIDCAVYSETVAPPVLFVLSVLSLEGRVVNSASEVYICSCRSLSPFAIHFKILTIKEGKGYNPAPLRSMGVLPWIRFLSPLAPPPQ